MKENKANRSVLPLAAAVLIALGAAAGCGKQEAGTTDGASPSPVEGAVTTETQPAAAAQSKPQSNEGAAKPETQAPVKLLFAQKWSEISDADFNTYIVEPLRQKYPHIEIEKLPGDNIPEMVAAGNVPDVVATWVNLLADYKAVDLVDDMTPLFKKHNFDTGRFEATYLDTIRGYGDGLVAVPYDANFNLNYYNKDIFDKFGVEYPKDGMTWDETLQLGKRLSREDQGVRYRGLEAGGYGKLALQIALPTVKDGKPYVNNEPWKKLLTFARAIDTLPGNEPVPDVHPRDQFIKNRNLAMFATGYNFNLLAADGAKDLNWDVAQYPAYPDQPDVMGMVDEHVAFVTKTSKHKDDAFRVVEMLSSDETQRKLTRASGKLSVLKDSGIRGELGKDMPALAGKHLEAIFKGRYIPAYTSDSRYPDAGKMFDEEAGKYMGGEQDLNTVLRTAEERMQSYIDQVNAGTGK